MTFPLPAASFPATLAWSPNGWIPTGVQPGAGVDTQPVAYAQPATPSYMYDPAYATQFDPSTYQPLYSDPVALYAAAQPTAYSPAPAQRYDVAPGFIDAVRGTLAAPTAAAAVVSAGAGVATLPYSADISPVTSSVERAVLGYSRGAARTGTSVIRKARRKGAELWAGIHNPRTVHVTQVPSKFNRSPAAGNRDCGPASVVMALRMVGKRIPGVVHGSTPQRAINAVRRLAGNVASTVSTTNFELERALQRAGSSSREIADAGSIRSAVLAGRPVILNGNPRNPGAYGWKFDASKMVPFNGPHWIVVSGWDSRSGKYIINDPLATAGAVKVSPGQLEAYRGGSMGIEVSG